jgi:lactate dehydrogenase-like 2-hydroxyacid dehydrogenase
LLAANIPPEHAAAIEEHFTLHRLDAADDKDAFLAEVGPRISGLVTSGFRGYDRKLLDGLPNVKIVSVWGAGLQALDLDAARERGIVVTKTPDDSKIAVAELGMGLLLAAARHCSLADAIRDRDKTVDRNNAVVGVSAGKATSIGDAVIDLNTGYAIADF